MMNRMLSPRVNELFPSMLRHYLVLDGEWDFTLDPDQVGEQRGYPYGEGQFEDTIKVPGCLEGQGKGLDSSELRQPAWAGTSDQPYFGMSWYEKRFLVPEKMEKRQLFLNFGGVSTDCKIWLNGRFLCEHHYGSVGFGVDVTEAVEFEKENILVVQVENRQSYYSGWPEETHGFGASTTEMRWSGIYRSVELVAVNDDCVQDVFLKPNAKKSQLTVSYELKGDIDEIEVTAISLDGKSLYRVKSAVYGSKGEAVLDMPGAQVWSDDDPVLYICTVNALKDGLAVDSITERFGLRDIAYDGEHLLLNDIPVYLRGDMAHFHWPETVSPCTDRNDLKQKLQAYKDYGMNFIRHHTFCPHQEYLDVCDELGLLCHNELGIISYTFKIAEEHGPEIWQASIKAGRNHPSVIIWCLGNEALHFASSEDAPTQEQMKIYKRLTFNMDDTRLLQDNSPGFFHYPDNRPKQKAPIHHEVRRGGSSYIDPSTKRHYVGALRPWRVQWAEERTKEAGIDHLLPVFVENTQALQALSRKIVLEDIRSNIDWPLDEYFRIPAVRQGFELCTFRDSGSFVWGVVDDYFTPKKVKPDEFRNYNDANVLLWDMKWLSRMLRSDGRQDFISVAISCSHYGKKKIDNGTLKWRVLYPNGEVYAEKEHPHLSLTQGQVTQLCEERVYFLKQEEVLNMTLEAVLTWDEESQIINSWSFWLFPNGQLEEAEIPVYDNRLDWTLRLWMRQKYPFVTPIDDEETIPANALLITSQVNDTLLNHLSKGGRAMLASRSCFSGEATEWGASRSEYARGTIIDKNHPLGNVIPNDGYCDIPFSGMISGELDLDGTRRNDHGCAIGLGEWPRELVPIIAGIPSYKNDEPQLLSHLMEVKVGEGKLLITTLDFYTEISNSNPATVYFCDQVLRYLVSDKFEPAIEVSAEFIRRQSRYSGLETKKNKF